MFVNAISPGRSGKLVENIVLTLTAMLRHVSKWDKNVRRISMTDLVMPEKQKPICLILPKPVLVLRRISFRAPTRGNRILLAWLFNDFRDLKCLTLVAEGREDIELLLGPNVNPPAREYQEAIYAPGIPATSFFVADIEKEHKRLARLGVSSKIKPTYSGAVKIAVFDDTCGNLIQLIEN